MRPGEVIYRHAEPVMGTVVSIDVRPQGLPMTRHAGRRHSRRARSSTAPMTSSACTSPIRPCRACVVGRSGSKSARPRCPQVVGLCEQAKLASAGWFDPWGLPGGFDPTGLVKGWAAHEAARVLEAAGIGARNGERGRRHRQLR